MHRGANRLATVLTRTAVATARLPQERNARLMRPAELRHDVGEGRPLRSAVPSRHMTALCLRRLVAVVPPITLQARASERGNAGRTAQARGRGSGYEAVACGDPRGLERLQGPPEGVIVARCGSHPGRHEAGGGVILGQPGDEGERVIPHPQAIEHHRVDGVTHGEVPPVRVWLRRSVEDVAHAEVVEQASHKAEVVQHLAAVRGGAGIMISSAGEESLQPL
jgi:hypothetical protein